MLFLYKNAIVSNSLNEYVLVASIHKIYKNHVKY